MGVILRLNKRLAFTLFFLSKIIILYEILSSLQILSAYIAVSIMDALA